MCFYTRAQSDNLKVKTYVLKIITVLIVLKLEVNLLFLRVRVNRARELYRSDCVPVPHGQLMASVAILISYISELHLVCVLIRRYHFVYKLKLLS